MNKSEKIIREVISISFKNNTSKKTIDCNKIINVIVIENHKNFHNINSYLLIGLLKIKKIVLPSISLKSNWLHTNKTQTNQKTSIIDNQKSTIILLSSQIVNFQSVIEKRIKTNAKNIIK